MLSKPPPCVVVVVDFIILSVQIFSFYQLVGDTNKVQKNKREKRFTCINR